MFSTNPADQLNPRVRAVPPSATLAINERSQALLAQGKQVYKLGLGQSPFPVAAPVVQALRQHAAEKDYLPVKGLWELRQAVADYHGRTDGVEIHPNNVIIGPGSKELLFLTQLALGGETILPSPCWVSYGPQAGMLGRPVGTVTASYEQRWRLQPEDLDAYCRRSNARTGANTDGNAGEPFTPISITGRGGRGAAPRLLILTYPGNPDGLGYTPAELKALAAVCREHHIIVISDEIYGPLHHDGAHVSIARYYPEGTIISGGLSKWCGAGGWRLGTFALPTALTWLGDAIAAAASETFTAVSAPIQYAAITAYQGSPEIDRYLADSRRILKGLGNTCAEIIRQSGARVHSPEGAFYLLVDCAPLRSALAARDITSDGELTETLLERTGVAMLPGVHFGRDPEELTVRLSYVNFDGAAALEAAAKLPPGDSVDLAFLEAYCGETLTAIRRFSAWLADL